MDIIDKAKVKSYFFPIEEIKRLSIKNPLSQHLISEEKPVILTDTNLCKSALKWTLPYLRENLGEAKYTVFSSPNHIFKYYDPKKVSKFTPNFNPSTTKMDLTFDEFIKAYLLMKDGGKRLYFQQPLNNTVGPAIVRDFLEFNWEWLDSQQKGNDWGPLTSNLLLIGMEGNLTPVHYDEQENFFCQLIGVKRCLLFAPEYYQNLYPHPVYHPHDRQSQVDLENPNFAKFPKLKEIKGQEAILYPGDVLFIPIYWWHHIESLHTLPTSSSQEHSSDSIRDPFKTLKYNVSVNFWYKGGVTKNIEYPLVPQHKLAMMRNIEKMLLEALKDPKEVGPMLRAIVDGRYSLGAEEEAIF